MTERGGTNNRISGGTVNGPAIQAENIESVETHVHYHVVPTPAPALPESEREPHAWVREVMGSQLWRAVPEARDPSGAMLAAAHGIAAALAVLHDEAERRLAGAAEGKSVGDPWWDRSFASRFHSQISQISQISQLACAEGGPDWDFRLPRSCF